MDDRFPGTRPAIGTLDGMAFMTVGVYTWPDQNNQIHLQYDYDAIQWLLDHVKGNPVVAEGRIDYYREGGMRVASHWPAQSPRRALGRAALQLPGGAA
ncbi:hypothetical protein [Candidatus Amarolinea dominans]|uniref:hypothetical protein n=1 Tax=Candidatus Amarolinea dominans TaxID=3140696 RepID=UPI0031352ED3|nr:hypothetical protein [Anaerolineae bacterium]